MRRGGERDRLVDVMRPAWVGSVTVAASLVIDDTIGTWSSSCSEPDPQRPAAARPPSTTSGEPLKCAEVIADTPLVTPGSGGEGGDARPAR